jgi:hypothetical protein
MNPKNRSSKSSLLSGYIILALCFLIAALVIGCLENYGRLNWDPQMTTQFQAYEAQSDFNYHYYGVGNRTFAIAGISNDFVMESKMWREVEPDTQDFKDLISRAWENPYYKPYSPRGAHILNSEGKRVGNWYSSLRFVTVKFGENNRIVLIPDTPFLGGPAADSGSGSGDFSNRISRIESNPYISYQLKAILTSN